MSPERRRLLVLNESEERDELYSSKHMFGSIGEYELFTNDPRDYLLNSNAIILRYSVENSPYLC
jgi:hypothetical protein